jgi:16S rRNA (cytosine967-C5)-methyltransferase
MSRRRPSHPGPPPAGRSRRATARRRPEDTVRSAAAWVVERTLASLAPASSFLGPLLERFDERDRGLLGELVFGTLRWLRRLDHVIDRASRRRFADIEPALLAPLRVATYQILFLDRVPAHAAVHEAVEQAHSLTHRGGASFVNAVLRAIARSPRLGDWPVEETDPVRRLAVEMSHPDFLVERWTAVYGAERTRALLAANNRPRPIQLLAFCDRGGRELLAERLIDQGLEVEPAALSLLGLTVRRGDPLAGDAFARGDFYVQDEASQAAALIPAPSPGERVLDAAAAPGGKAFALIAREPSLAPVLADLSLERLMRVRANLARLRRRLPVVAADAGQPPFAGEPVAGGFDRVVLDLPCTGTGTLRKHPELKWRISPGEIGRLAGQAERMLAGVAPLVVPGGHLAAITCSIEPEENERVVERFLERHPGFAPLPLAGTLAPPLDAGIEAPGRWRVLPGGDHDGFTANVLVRSGDGGARQRGRETGGRSD